MKKRRPKPQAPVVLPEQRLLAARWRRFVARWIDALLSGLAGLCGYVAIHGPGSFREPPELMSDLAFLDFYAGSMLLLVLQSWLQVRVGQTLGRSLMSIRVVDEQGDPPGFLRGWLGREILMTIPLVGLVDLAFIVGRERRCLHDRLFGTWVVYA